MKKYYLRTGGSYEMDWNVAVDDQLNDRVYPLPLCLEYVKHSPDGFGWGYEGSGPSQLAFAILYDLTKDLCFTREKYQEFKRDVVAKLEMSREHALSEQIVRSWCVQHNH